MRCKLLLFLIALCALTAAAQPPARILKRAEKAMGGARGLQGITSWEKSGTIRRVSDGAAGNITMRAARPNFYNLTFDVSGFEIESGYNGKSGWMRDSRNGLRTLTGGPSTAFQAEAAFRSSLWLDAKKERSRITSGGTAEVAGKSANVIVVNTAKGAAVKLFFDSATALLVREEFSTGEARRSFEYSDYRPVDGLVQAHKARIEIDGAIYDAVFDEVRTGARIARTEFDFPDLSGAPLPDIPSLLKELHANQDKVENILDTYSYVQRSTSRILGNDGVLRDKESVTYQLSFYKGFRMRRLIEKNGKPLSAGEQEDEDKAAGKRVEEIEKQIVKREAQGERSDEDRRISISEVLRASLLTNPRRERFRGRDVIVFDFEPNPNFDYKNAKSMLKFFGKMAGAMWIDENDKQVARIEAILADSINIGGGVVAKLRKGASFTLEQERVNDEIWLPSATDINLSVRVLLVKGIDMNQSIRSYDYRKFTTEVKDAKVDPLKQNP